mgnify:CR=1 FL=1
MLFIELISLSLFIFFINQLSSLIAHRRSKLIREPYTPLPDILHDIFPVIDKNVPDYFLCILLLNHIYAYDTMNEYEYSPLIYSLLLRPFFVISTTLPSCLKNIHRSEQSYYNRLFVTSHDLIYSGHTLFFLFFGNSYRGNIGKTIQYILPLTLISSRQHYTIDVLVSIFIYNYFKINS